MRISKGLSCKWILIPHDTDDHEFIKEYFPRAEFNEYKDLKFYKIGKEV